MDKSFEENYKKIESLLEEIENNKDNLDKSVKLYKEAKELYKKLEASLDDYRAKVEIIDSDE
ncbi:exodeoxyribonuclease VII small subunit [Anaerococcus sp. NML200574]|uniref:Exodeoxyribonuclease VII small subunit n=1 Tax=Anaerococcus kampingae TaxID=3115614 RepID=A0ABW9MF22_9FIRM|nr:MULTISPECIES: exodeoxyribonuclease VII small subunit [unclassified Anaerococcus]MCW6677838.1 exodeoxyribonuclease VII small subunit [Anaerococcus sp. NML200574]MCW6701607.1 exodeoxyribonuclease VII small subunit [Anaerococcus sp. NML200537]